MKISKLSVKKFRHLKDLELKFGKRVTAIAGQNGTGKSSLLGLIGHVFTFDKQHKTLDKKPFFTEYSEIFRFAWPEYDKAKEHSYSLRFEDGDEVPVLSYDRREGKKSVGLRLYVGKKRSGKGKKELPVIYLGLRRLFPLAQEAFLTKDPLAALTSEEVAEYQRLHNEILILDEEINPEYVLGFGKRFWAPKTLTYDSIGNSAGQDNLGQIITAVLSFARLKKELGSAYPGGILLIDEIDATFYPAAQEKLIEKLFRISSDLDLQVIFTTHSLDILQRLKLPRYGRDSEIVYLDKSSGVVKNVQDGATIERIINDLRVVFPEVVAGEKTMVFCEDLEASIWIKSLLGRDILKRLEIVADSFGGAQLVTIANKRIRVFKKSIFILDGDQDSSLRNNRCPRVLLLPGEARPEDVFFNFLKGLPPSDSFWTGFGGYTKQICFKDLNRLSSDRAVMKDWFNSQLRYWGRGAARLFKRWAASNEGLVEDFVRQVKSVLS